MIPVDEARARIVAALCRTAEETVALGLACGRTLSADVQAGADQPPFPVSAMDGYAVRPGDAPPLKLVGSAPAGHPFPRALERGEAVRIFTGGVVPEGAGAIVIQENARIEGGTIGFDESARAPGHIRAAGLDFRAGAVLAKEGQTLSPRDLALLAAGDVASVRVRARPRIAFAATGDELTRPGEKRKPGGIVASSGYGLAALIERWGGDAQDLGILPDTIEAIASIVGTKADLIVTLGGASVGAHDLVQKALGPKGFTPDFWKIAMRPGKPLIFGRLGRTPLLGLPGNPVSSLVSAHLFLRPAIRAMLGAEPDMPLRVARLAGPLPANDTREDYVRAHTVLRDGENWIEAFPVQDSSMLGVFAQADALIRRVPHAAPAAMGERVEYLPLDE